MCHFPLCSDRLAVLVSNLLHKSSSVFLCFLLSLTKKNLFRCVVIVKERITENDLKFSHLSLRRILSSGI
jgi:hypothetical protein